MSRGSNDKSINALEQNRQKTQFCGERAVKAARKKAEIVAVIKPLKEYIQQELNSTESGSITKEKLARSLLDNAMRGNIKAFELVLKLIGEYPTEEVIVTAKVEDCSATKKMIAELRNHMQERNKGDNA